MPDLSTEEEVDALLSAVNFEQTAPEHKKKPPLGIMPKKEFVRRRKMALLEAMYRFVTCDEDIPEEWINELMELQLELEL